MLIHVVYGSASWLYGTLLNVTPDGQLHPVSDVPLLLKCPPLCFAGPHVVFADHGYIAVWNLDSDTTATLAHHASIRPGGLNNRDRWNLRHVSAMPDQRTLQVLIQGASRRDASAEAEHWLIDLQTHATSLLRSSTVKGVHDCLDGGDHLLLRTGSDWQTWPLDPRRPVVSFPPAAKHVQAAASGTRGFFLGACEMAGSVPNRREPISSACLLLVEGTSVSGPARMWTVRAPGTVEGLHGFGNDLVLQSKPPLVIRDAFTRELPPEGTDIVLREVAFTPR
jgi:hypothetical protein